MTTTESGDTCYAEHDAVQLFLAGSTEDRLRLTLDPSHADALRAYLGDAAFAQFATIARRTLPALDDQAHLSRSAPTNLIFVPGIMGSLLLSRSLGGVWWIDPRTRGHLNDLRLAPDGQHDADPNHDIAAFSTDPSYEAFLAAVIRREEFGHDTFPFDWRKPFAANSKAFYEKISRTYDANGQEPVHLVAHSMGGLMVRAMLMEYGDRVWPKLGRIVFIGTPHYGSPSIAGYLKNHFWGTDLLLLLGLYISRQAFRSLWGALAMLPAPVGVYPGTRTSGRPWSAGDPADAYPHPCANFDMYQAHNWHLDLSADERAQLQTILDGTASFHQQMYAAHRRLSQEYRDRMAVIVGVGQKTLFRVAYDRRFFGLWERTEKVTSRIEGDEHREGDGRVPLLSARLESVGEARCVKGEHSGLPMIPAVYDDVFRWLRGERMHLPETVEDALSQHLAGGALASELSRLDGSSRVEARSDDPGYWNADTPDRSHLDELDAMLARGELPEFITARLL